MHSDRDGRQAIIKHGFLVLLWFLIAGYWQCAMGRSEQR